MGNTQKHSTIIILNSSLSTSSENPYSTLNGAVFNNLTCIIYQQNGVLSALPYLTMWISALISGVICDWLIEKKGFNITAVRKTFITIGYDAFIINTYRNILGQMYIVCSYIDYSEINNFVLLWVE